MFSLFLLLLQLLLLLLLLFCFLFVFFLFCFFFCISQYHCLGPRAKSPLADESNIGCVNFLGKTQSLLLFFRSVEFPVPPCNLIRVCCSFRLSFVSFLFVRRFLLFPLFFLSFTLSFFPSVSPALSSPKPSCAHQPSRSSQILQSTGHVQTEFRQKQQLLKVLRHALLAPNSQHWAASGSFCTETFGRVQGAGYGLWEEPPIDSWRHGRRGSPKWNSYERYLP